MERFPYPSGVNVVDSVTLKLCSTNYLPWKEQMLKFLASHNLSGFVSIDSTYNRPTKPDSLLDSSEFEDKRWEEEEEKYRESKLREDGGRKDMWARDGEQERMMRQEAEWEQMGREAYWAGETEWERERERKRREAEGERVRREAEQERERREGEQEQEREWEKLEREREKRERRKSEFEAAKLICNEWKRSDDLVIKWILETVTKEIQLQVMHLGSARDVWIKISKILAQPFQLSHLQQIDWTDDKRGQTVSKYVVLHKAALTADWDAAVEFLDKTPGAALAPITWCSETALIVAIRSAKRNHFVRKLILRMLWESEKARVPQQLPETSRATTVHAAAGAPQQLQLVEAGISEATTLHAAVGVPQQQQLAEAGISGATTVHAAVGVPQQQQLAETDISGATALHAAAGGGNIVAAKWLLQKNPELANIKDKHGTLAVHVAAGLGDRKMVDFLLDPSTNLSERESGCKLLHSLASSGLYDIALTFLQKNPKLASTEPSPLVVMAQKRTSFPSGTKLNLVQCLIYSVIPLKLEGISNRPQASDIEDPTAGGVTSAPINVIPLKLEAISNRPQARDIEDPTAGGVTSAPINVWQMLYAFYWDVAEKLVPFLPLASVRETKNIHHQALDLVKCLCEAVVKDDQVNAAEIFTGPLRIATCVGIHEIVEEILLSYPSAIHMRSEKDQSLFHLAIVHRREKVFNLIYQMEEKPHAFLSMPDASTNNALHSAGDLGEHQKLLLRASAAGAALQMQRELQWFEEVGKVLLPQAKELMNAEGQTPQEVFTKTHENLVEQGEKWMKETATSCTIVAALIMTIVFAAAITVPGGSDNNIGSPTSGLPILKGSLAFTLFLVSNALALFFSSSSLLIFLSILTSRYGQEDFLNLLPKRMIKGLVGLFFSIISMMVAFGATLKIVSDEKKLWIIVCVAVLSGLPIILFVWLQFPLLYLMIESTYRRGIFRKQSDRILH